MSELEQMFGLHGQVALVTGASSGLGAEAARAAEDQKARMRSFTPFDRVGRPGEIELDGSPLGVTPLAAIEVEPGRHRFRARMADGRVLQRDVVLSPERRHLVFE
jgi:NAD(P)-dependent dehydrogenase (short-subunit alcohol dehydrogenase family)